MWKRLWLLGIAAIALWWAFKPDTPVVPVPPKPPVVVVKPPIEVDGLRVLIVQESEDATPKTAAVVLAQDWRTYVKSKGGDFRCLDDDVDVSGDAPEWATALARERKSLPWVIVSNGKTGFEGPLPLGDGELLALIRKYGD